jgi:hypothetical protein
LDHCPPLRKCQGNKLEVGDNMKNIYKYYCVLFIGSILPFLIAELYLQNYVTIGYLGLLSSAILTSCFIVEYLRVKLMQRLEIRRKDLEDFGWKKEKAGRASSYYFSNYW